MAHKSKKKHIKHLRQHGHDANAQPAKAPGAKATSAALGSQTSHKVRLTSKARAAAKSAVKARAGRVKAAAKGRVGAKAQPGAKKRGGIVRSIAKAAGDKITARPKRIISRAKARVKSLLGRDGRAAA